MININMNYTCVAATAFLDRVGKYNSIAPGSIVYIRGMDERGVVHGLLNSNVEFKLFCGNFFTRFAAVKN